MYISNIVQQIRCGEISRQRQFKEIILVTLETTYLVEINKVGLVYEENCKKNIHRNEIVFRCFILRNIINNRSVLDSAEKCK